MRQGVSLASIMHLGRARLLLFVSLFLALSVAVPWFIYDKVNGQPLSLDERWLSWPFVLSVLLLLSAYYLFDGLRLYFTLRALGRPVPLREQTPLVSNIKPMASGGIVHVLLCAYFFVQANEVGLPRKGVENHCDTHNPVLADGDPG